MELLSGNGKRGVELGLLSKKSDILDNDFLSKYFVLQEFSPTLTAGKNVVTFNGSELLKSGSEILVECLDSDGNSLYIESTTSTTATYKESSSNILSVYIFSENSNGPGKLTFYGIAKNGATVKWIGNVIIDKSKRNSSSVRFYQKPTLELRPILSPVLSSVGDLNKTITLSGSFYTFAVTPTKDTLLVNQQNVDTDYRLFNKSYFPPGNPTASFNAQLENVVVDLYVKTIQSPFSFRNSNVAFTTSLSVKRVLNDSSLMLSNVITSKDGRKNEVVVNVVDGEFHMQYPYVVYNTASESSSYLVSNTNNSSLVKQSFVDVIYRNLKTFSGFISRHKLYRKSLFSPGDFELIADEPLTPYELLRDRLTTNKSFDKMGSFYNQRHVDKYWFSNSPALTLNHSSDVIIDALSITPTSSYSRINSLTNFVIVKDNSSNVGRDSTYIAYDASEFQQSSGSSYDSNFLELKSDVSYLLSFDAILKKDNSVLNDVDVGLEFYFTSSSPGVSLENNAVKEQRGLLKLGEVWAVEPIREKSHTDYKILFTVSSDLYGTIVVVPRKCAVMLSKLSLKPYGDFGFSPDTLITRIPFPVNIANESFEIKAELFDVNSNLVYSDLRKIASFDASGSSLSSFIPGLKDPNKTTFISGSLEVSKSLWVGQDIYTTGSIQIGGTISVSGIVESSYTNERLLSWNPDSHRIVYTNVNDIDYDGIDSVVVKLMEKNSDSSATEDYRLLPSVTGRNVFVPKKNTGFLPASVI